MAAQVIIIAKEIILTTRLKIFAPPTVGADECPAVIVVENLEADFRVKTAPKTSSRQSSRHGV
jgi:hypothetical protein